MWLILDGPPGAQDALAVDDGVARRVALPAEGAPGAGSRLEGMAHVLPHGGDVVDVPVQLVDERLLRDMGASHGFLPDEARRLIARTSRMLELFPGVPHVVLCDTAFFRGLPVEASLYAVPFQLSARGIRRYGRDGLIHEWVWRQVAGLRQAPGRLQASGCLPALEHPRAPVSRMISLRLGNHTNLAAIRDGRPVDTSVGFTALEGLPSDTASGDVDPNLLFHLSSRGFRLEEIIDTLSRRSGFSGYCGRRTGFADLTKASDAAACSARAIFLHAVMKYVGASLATLGGIDVLALSAENGWDALPMAMEVCGRLGFLGVRVNAPGARDGDEPAILSSPDSSIPVVFFPTRRWMIIHHQAVGCRHQATAFP